MDKRSLEQLKLYQGYCKQLIAGGTLKINVGGTKVWEGDLHEYVLNHYKDFLNNKGLKDMARYLLKIMDVELITRNPITSSNANKNHFDEAFKEDLTHHISWLREVLFDNNITPFNEHPIY